MALTRKQRIDFLRAGITLVGYHPGWGQAELPEAVADSAQGFIDGAVRGLGPEDDLWGLAQDLLALIREASR